MPVTAALSRKFYETFGDDLTNELVTWLNEVGTSYRTEFKELFEVNFAAQDARLERRMADVFREIHDEEVWHGPAEVRTIAKRITDDADWERATHVVRDVCRQRLTMRNEMFSRPLSDARLDAIAAGSIEPWPMPIDL